MPIDDRWGSYPRCPNCKGRRWKVMQRKRKQCNSSGIWKNVYRCPQCKCERIGMLGHYDKEGLDLHFMYVGGN